MQELNLKEIQLEELKILKEVVEFLNKHNIQYTVSYGTLLGAVRHKGFIPWDDDIDISIPRPEYNRLQEILKLNNHIANNIYAHSFELQNLNLPFTKIYNYDIEYDDFTYHGYNEKYLWIDVFPIDGLPEDKNKVIKLYKLRNLYRWLSFYRKKDVKAIFNNDNNIFYNLPRLFIKGISYLLPARFYAKRIINLTKKYPYDTSKYIGCLVWGTKTDKLPKNEMLEYILLDFEDIKVSAFKNYDIFLTKIYGNYMEIPPEDQRLTHKFHAWRVKNEVKN